MTRQATVQMRWKQKITATLYALDKSFCQVAYNMLYSSSIHLCSEEGRGEGPGWQGGTVKGYGANVTSCQEQGGGRNL